MANKIQFPDGFNPKGQINKLDKILIADAVSGQPFITTLDTLNSDKVDKVNGKSLVLDTLVTKLSNDYTKEQIDGIVSGINSTVGSLSTSKVDKVNGKSLVLDTLVTKLSNDYTKEQIDGIVSALNDSINDITTILSIIKTDGSGNKYLAEDGTYKTIVVPTAPIQSLSVDGVNVIPDVNGNVEISIPSAPVQSISLNGEALEPDVNGNVNVNVVVDVEQTIDPMSTNPVSSSAVASEFAQLSAKYGTAVQLQVNGEDENKTYAISLLDENGEILSTTDEFEGGGGSGGGEVATTRIVLLKTNENFTVKQGDEVTLGYYFDHRDSEGISTGNPANVTITITSGSIVKTLEKTVQGNTTNTIDVTKDVQVGTNTIRIRASVDNGESVQVSTINYRIQVVNLRLTSSFDFSVITNKGNNVTVPYYLTGSGNKVISAYVDGVKVEDKTVLSSTSSGSFIINTSLLNHGSHSIQMVAELTISDTQVIKSNSIYFDIIVRENNVYQSIVATRFEYTDGSIIGFGERPYISVRQFEDYAINYVGYNPNQNTNVVNIIVNDKIIQTVNTTPVQRQVISKADTVGEYGGIINIGNYNYTFGVRVVTTNINLTEPSDNLTLKLSAQGRNNNEVNKDTWSYNGITTTFSDVQYSGDGWINNALRLLNGGQAVINHRPLINTTNGFTFTTRFKASSVSDTNKVLYSCINNGVGFTITSEEVVMTANGNSSVAMKLASGETYNIALVSFPTATANSSDYERLNSNMMFLYINGIMSGGVQRGNSESLNQNTPTNITIKGDGCILDVYNVRCYNSFLTDSQVLDLHILDMDNVNDIISKYQQNDILDNDGQVTVESVPDNMRYMIITGNTSNMTTVAYAKMMNNKDTRYAVDEILHIKKSEPNLNFKCVGGCIRLQGTSSLAYPIKNFRFYFRSASSSSVFGTVYTGTDTNGNGGTLVTDSKPKVSFKNANNRGKIPAPVNAWCLKADFAESSSSHNTGIAKLANDVFVESGSPTPPQKHVSPNYPYDVRTTVDGEPCYLFARSTVNDTPIFIGKFNLNNDKSTEEVFGFLDIPSYHKTSDGSLPSSWITEKFNGINPTECWEFKSNDTAMGSYLDDDFDTMEDGSPKWMKTFESRFPDNNDSYLSGLKKPERLKRIVSWVKSTQNNPTKFRNELHDYFDVPHLCKYFALTQLFGMVDQMVKNAMLGIWYNPDKDKMLGYYIFYDNDTVMGVRNDGRLKYDPFINRQTIDPETNTYAFMGHDSVLWNNLESQFANEIRDAYISLRANLNNQYIIDMFGKNQSEKFSERIYNIDAMNKYIIPKTLGVPVLINGEVQTGMYSYMESMQGSRSSHRKWWLTNRLSSFDARFGTGGYLNNALTWKGTSLAGATIKATPSKDYYFQLRRESNIQAHNPVTANVEWSYTYPDNANIGTIFTFYGADFTKKLDLSNWGGFTDLTLPNLSVLEELILGSSSKTYGLTELVIGNKIPMMRKIDITNYTNLSSLDLTNSNNVETIIANGCTSLSSVNIASGSPLTRFEVPIGLRVLKLVGLRFLNNSGLVIPNNEQIESVIIEDTPLIDWKELLNNLTVVSNIRLININTDGDKALLEKLYLLNGINDNGVVVQNQPVISGVLKLQTYLNESDLARFRNKFPDLEIRMPEYSRYTVYQGVTLSASIYNDDNGTGYDPSLIVQNKPYVCSGHAEKIINSFHRYLGKHSSQGVQTIIQLNDENSNYFKDGSNANIDGSNGDVWVKKPKFWYKGINDILNNKNYIYVSSNVEKPTVGEHYKVTQSDVVTTLANMFLRTNGATLTTSLSSDTKYSIAKIRIPSGWSKVRLPMIPYGKTALQVNYEFIGSLFLDANDSIISPIRLDGSISAEGMYVIIDIPTNAKYIYHTYNNFLGLKETIFFNGDIYNAEPNWVESDEFLINAFPISIKGNQEFCIGANIDGSKPLQRFANTVDFYDKLTYKGWDSLYLKDFNELNWLHVLKYGTFRVDNTVGTGVSSTWYNTDKAFGLSSLYGMRDTTRNGYLINGNQINNSDGHMSFLGIESLWGSVTTAGDQVRRGWNDNTPHFIYLSQGNRTISYTPSYKSWQSGDDYYLKRDTLFSTRFYMELFIDPMDVGTSAEGTNTTYLASRKNENLNNTSNNTGSFVIRPYHMNGGSGSGGSGVIGLFTWVVSDSSNYTNNRATWRRQIVEIQSPTVFNGLNNV